MCVQGVPYWRPRGITAESRKAMGKGEEGAEKPLLAAAYADNRYKAFRRTTKESTGQPRGSPCVYMPPRAYTLAFRWYYYTGWRRATAGGPVSRASSKPASGFIPFVETARDSPRVSSRLSRKSGGHWLVEEVSFNQLPCPFLAACINGTLEGRRTLNVCRKPGIPFEIRGGMGEQRASQKATSYFDKSRGSLLITGVHCDIQPSGIQGFNIIDTQQRGRHPRLLKESLSIERRTLLLYPPVKRSKPAASRQEFFIRGPRSVKLDQVLTVGPSNCLRLTLRQLVP